MRPGASFTFSERMFTLPVDTVRFRRILPPTVNTFTQKSGLQSSANTRRHSAVDRCGDVARLYGFGAVLPHAALDGVIRTSSFFVYGAEPMT